MTHLSYKSLFIILFLLLIPIIFLFKINQPGKTVYADWFDEGWSYRQAINISSHTVGETSVYIITSINIGTTTKSQSDNGDFRFTTQSGQLLDYYLASGAGTTAPTFHILIDSFPAGAQTIYAYYGNPGASNGFSPTDFATLASNYTIGSLSTEEVGGGPVAYWKFDEGVGTSARDSTQNGNHAIFGSGTSAPTWVTDDQCVSGKCLKFNGTTQYVNAGHPATLQTFDKITISAWIKGNSYASADYNMIAGKYLDHYLSIYDSKIRFRALDITSNITDGTTTLNPNKWYHVVATYDGSFVRLYLNGVQDNFEASSGTITDTSHDYFIGSYSSSLFFNGYLDDIKIYPYARSATQIKQDYNLGSANIGSNPQKYSSDGLVAYYKFDEGVGTTSADSSGNSNLATLNSASWGSGKYGTGTTFSGSQSITIGSTISNIYSVSLWYYASDTAPQFLTPNSSVDIGATTSTIFTVGISSPTIFVDGVQSTSIGSTNTWHHLIITTASPITGNQINFGKTSSLYLNGRLDEIKLYNRTLSATDVKNLYNYSPAPVGYWKFDEGVGTTAYDSSGNGFNGTLGSGNSAPSWTTGKIGKGLSFDGSNDSVSVADNNNLRFGTNDFTISSWIKFPITDGLAWGGILTKGYTTAIPANTWGLVRSSTATNQVRFIDALDVGGTANANLNSSLFFDGWHHVTVSRSGSIYSIYSDGIRNSSATYSTANLNSTSPLNIGGYANLRYINGSIDEVKIYNYARTQEQILQDMQGSPKLGGPILYYKFDKGSGSTANNSGIGGTLNGTFGTGTSSPTWVSGKVNKGLSFSTNDYLSVGGTITNTQSISFWVNPTGITNNNFLSLSSTVAVGATGNTLFATGFTSPTIYINGVGTSLLTNNVWQHVVITTGTTITSNTINIGKNSTNFFTGSLDEIKIYNYALSADEVKTDYNAGTSVVFGASNQTIGATTTSLDYCLPGDTSPCSPPVAEYKFEEGVGTTAYDTSGNGNNGTWHGTGNHWGIGKHGKSGNFDGSSDYVDISTFTDLDTIGTGDFSIESWFKLPSADAIYDYFINLAGATDGPSSQILLTFTSNGLIEFRTRANATNSSTTTTSAFADNRWHHVAGIRDTSGTRQLIYVDGLLVKNDTVTARNVQLVSPPLAYTIGRYTSGAPYYYQGQIDEVKIYNYARTPAQIAYDYNKGAPIGWWKLDECQGSVANDSSGVGNSGAITIGASGTQNSLGTCSVGTSAAWTAGASGKINSSLNFDGTDDVISIGGTRAINTVSFWTKPTSSTTNLLQLNSTTNITASSGILSATGFTTPTYYVNGVGTSAISANIWQLVTISTGSTINANLVKIGQVGSNYYSGQIDDVRLYNYPLTSTQIKTLYNGGSVNFR